MVICPRHDNHAEGYRSCFEPCFRWSPTVCVIVAIAASSPILIFWLTGRNDEYLKLAIKFTVDVFNDKDYVNRFPKVLKP